PAPGQPSSAQDILLERVVTHLTSAIGRMFGGGDPDEPIALARLACAVGDDGPHAEVHAAVLEQLDLFREHLAPPPPGRPFPAAGRFIVGALTIARTPDVPLPPRPSAPHPTREEADARAGLAFAAAADDLRAGPGARLDRRRAAVIGAAGADRVAVGCRTAHVDAPARAREPQRHARVARDAGEVHDLLAAAAYV